MKYAIIQTGGKQYKVTEGDVVDVERLALSNPSEKITFSEVLLVADGADVVLGKPVIKDMFVTGQLVENLKGEKIRVAKFKSKVRHRRVRGHRQSLSRVSITTIGKGVQAKKEEVQEVLIAKPKRVTKKTS
jgi:large subunit ribosomal protein L21